MALGVSRGGYEHVAVNECDTFACQTLRLNTDWPVMEADSHDVDWKPFAGKVGLVSGGAPCQPFSVGGLALGDEDDRNLFPELVRAVREIRPHAVVVENVRGLGRPAFREYLDYILDCLAVPDVAPKAGELWERHRARVGRAKNSGDAAYHVHGPQVINAADFGVPQARQRLFVVAFRTDLVDADAWEWPKPTHTRDTLLWDQLHGPYWDEHRLRPRKPPSGPRKGSQALLAALAATERPPTKRWRTVRDALAGLPDPRSAAARTLDGHDYVATKATTYHGHTGNLMDWPAKTVKAGVHGVPGGEGIVRFDNGRARRLTVRETARLQTFPDDWRIVGPRSRRLRQLGNAVPVAVAETLASAVRTTLQTATS
jgi:DNA (cytosine-5)-methyltransferase 1